MAEVKLSVEERYYQRMKKKWLKTKRGLYVLIHKRKVIGFYRNVEGARYKALLIILREHEDTTPTVGNFIRHPMLIRLIKEEA